MMFLICFVIIFAFSGDISVLSDPICVPELPEGVCTTNTIETREQSIVNSVHVKTCNKELKCCPGFFGDPYTKSGCVPQCEAPCTHGIYIPLCHELCENGHCASPDGCVCSPGYINLNERCLPVCKGGCGEAMCIAPEICMCQPGYGFANRECLPVCSVPCGEGVCSHPETCSCEEGFVFHDGKCLKGTYDRFGADKIHFGYKNEFHDGCRYSSEPFGGPGHGHYHGHHHWPHRHQPEAHHGPHHAPFPHHGHHHH